MGEQKSIIKESSIEKAVDKTKKINARALLVIPKGFSENVEEMKGAELEVYSIMKGLSMGELVSSDTLKSIISGINQKLAVNFVQQAIPGKNPEDIISPIRTREFVVVKEKTFPGNPDMIKDLATSQSIMIPMILMLVIMYSGMMVITSMGMEKENKTMETLYGCICRGGNVCSCTYIQHR